MVEYISRETMIKLLQRMADYAEANGFYYDREVIEFVAATLAGIPAADVAPVVHGSLTHTGTLWSSLWICTNCNETAYYPPHGNRKKRIIQPCGYKFCPNCGAKMDEVDSK